MSSTPRGRLATRVRVPPRSPVVGLGRSHMYVARADEDDLQWIERFRRPWSGPHSQPQADTWPSHPASASRDGVRQTSAVRIW